MSQPSGVFPAVVIDNVDPENRGRVKVRLPGLGAAGHGVWARIATLMAGNDRGTWFIPDVNDEVLVAFEGGDARDAYVLGALWSGADSPPATQDPGNHRKLIRSRNGVQITLDDQSGRERFIVETPGGQKITLADGPGAVEITDGNGNSVLLEPAGVTVNAAAKVTLNASQVEVNAGLVRVEAGISRFSGMVQCDTLLSNTVISATITPGPGNIW